ncbi:hypothetical protein PSHT_09408 [Puccinia striiformis]|nr:hypothetical protein PSHT_09408 [Puccinia striiformis]POW13664.1 hypothetical protein PSTT_03589 [Puccinia striiformis]
MGMDPHLKQYPGGMNLSLTDYADKVGATNFYCGIGNDCNPSQTCVGINQQDWYALAAAHRFNTFVNQIYEATAYALGVVSDLSPTMVDDLIPDATNFWNFSAVYVGILTAWITGIPAAIFGGGVGSIIWMVMMSTMFVGSAAVWVVANLYIPDPQKFVRWSEVIYRLQDFENHMQGALSNFTQNVIDSGISTEQGLYGISKEGNLFDDMKFRTESEIQTDLEQTLKLRSLSHILKIQNAFVTRGSQPCNGDGPNGALNEPGKLSYCDNGGIMMNIVLAGEKDREEPIYNAAMVADKYGLSTELLTTTAWRCQQKYGVYRHPTVVNATQPYDTSSDCLFNLPVCDLTDPAIRDNKHHMGVVEACRKLGKLPI